MPFNTFSSGIAILKKRLRETRAGSSSLCIESFLVHLFLDFLFQYKVIL